MHTKMLRLTQLYAATGIDSLLQCTALSAVAGQSRAKKQHRSILPENMATSTTVQTDKGTPGALELLCPKTRTHKRTSYDASCSAPGHAPHEIML